MIRTFAVLAGGSLGFAAVLMLANPPVPETSVTISADYAELERRSTQSDNELNAHPERVRHDPLSTDGANERDRTREASLVLARRDEPFVDTQSELYRLQVELVRMDCFAGRVNGAWSLAFHEALSNVVMTAELDLRDLGTTSKVLAALRNLEVGACGGSGEVAVHFVARSSPNRTVQASTDVKSVTEVVDVDTTMSQVAALARAYEQTPESSEIETAPESDFRALERPYIFPVPEGRHAEVLDIKDVPHAEGAPVDHVALGPLTEGHAKTRSPDAAVAQGRIEETSAVRGASVLESSSYDVSPVNVVVRNVTPVSSDPDVGTSGLGAEEPIVAEPLPLPERNTAALRNPGVNSPDNDARSVTGPSNSEPRPDRSVQRAEKRTKSPRRAATAKKSPARKRVSKPKAAQPVPKRSWKHNRSAIFSSRG